MKRLLFVDDETMFRELLASRLQSLPEDIAVTPVSSCEEAFALLEKGVEFDLVLMDLTLSLPGMSGAEGIRKLRNDYPDLPVVALSGARDGKTMRKAIDDGAMGFIPKTHSAELLLWALKLILIHKGIYVPPEVLLDLSEKVTNPESIGIKGRHADVLYELLKGSPNKVIARELGIELQTVKKHVNVVLSTLKVTNRTQAVIAAGQMNLAFGKQAGSRITYTCPGCGTKVSGQEELALTCVACGQSMQGGNGRGDTANH